MVEEELSVTKEQGESLRFLANSMVVELVADQERNYPSLITAEQVHAPPEKALTMMELLISSLAERCKERRLGGKVATFASC